MQQIVFSKEYLTGHKEIDTQHKAMFEWANRMIARKHWSRALLDRAIHFLVTYARFHFASEEHIMEQLRYPKTDEHKAQHKLLLREICALESAAKAGRQEQALMGMVQNVFESWMINHITDVDMLFINFLRIHKGELSYPMPSTDELVRRGRQDTRSEVTVQKAEELLQMHERDMWRKIR